jgi:hypothetical protein
MPSNRAVRVTGLFSTTTGRTTTTMQTTRKSSVKLKHPLTAAAALAGAVALLSTAPAAGAAGGGPLFEPLDAAAPVRAIAEFSADSLDARVASGTAFVVFHTDATQDSRAILQDILDATPADVLVGAINLSPPETRAKAAHHGIKNVPTFIVFKDGVPVSTIVGLRDKAIFIDAINAVRIPPATPPAPVTPHRQPGQPPQYQPPAEPAHAAQPAVPETRGIEDLVASYSSNPAPQGLTGGAPQSDWQDKWYLGAGIFRAGPIKWEGGGNLFDSSTGLAVTFGQEWRKGKIGFAIEDFFTFSRQSENYRDSSTNLSAEFLDFNALIMGRILFYPGNYVNFSVGAGIGCGLSSLEIDASIYGGYYNTSVYSNDMCFNFCGNFDIRFSITPTKNFAMDIGSNFIFTPSRDYDLDYYVLGLKGGARSFIYLGVRFLF